MKKKSKDEFTPVFLLFQLTNLIQTHRNTKYKNMSSLMCILTKHSYRLDAQNAVMNEFFISE